MSNINSKLDTIPPEPILLIRASRCNICKKYNEPKNSLFNCNCKK